MKKKQSEKSSSELFEVILTNNEEISPGVHVISFNRTFDFLPGQAIKIAVDKEHPPRIYSICSGNKESEVRILFSVKEDGFLTPKLSGMIPGETILVSEPYGSFIGTEEKAWFISTGTGIAPFYSMIQSGLTKNKTLIHGARYLNQFYFEEDLEWLLGQNYIRCCSRESSCDIRQQRVTDYIDAVHEMPAVKYYLCGNPAMVVEVRDLLIDRGVPFEKIIAEIYF